MFNEVFSSLFAYINWSVYIYLVKFLFPVIINTVLNIILVPNSEFNERLGERDILKYISRNHPFKKEKHAKFTAVLLKL